MAWEVGKTRPVSAEAKSLLIPLQGYEVRIHVDGTVFCAGVATIPHAMVQHAFMLRQPKTISPSNSDGSPVHGPATRTKYLIISRFSEIGAIYF
jgi:hypothetical protein